MATKIAFLRAINLGARRKFPKDEIVAATQAAGFTDVATHINTGNVRFGTSMRSRPRIEKALEAAYLERTGFDVPSLVFDPAELTAIVEYADQLAAGYDGKHFVSLLRDEPDAAAVEALEARAGEGTQVSVRGRAVHLLMSSYLDGTIDNAVVEKHVGLATNRNLRVIRTIVDKWC